jgi:hypothetical protein
VETVYFSETIGELLPDYTDLTHEDNTLHVISVLFLKAKQLLLYGKGKDIPVTGHGGP